MFGKPGGKRRPRDTYLEDTLIQKQRLREENELLASRVESLKERCTYLSDKIIELEKELKK